jgi:outer membrane protein assembly factor BamE (lipoprotein component of BamABCDE complex)
MKNINIICLFFCCFISCSGESDRERDLFRKIKVGMTTNEVIEILGKPDDTTYSVVDSSEFCFYFFTKNKSGLRSSFPDVCFDSNNTVNSVDYGE